MFPQGTKSVQTAFRFSPDLLQRMKNRARLRGQSLNSYVETLVKKDLGTKEERYEALYRELAEIELPKEISPEVNEFMDKHKVEFSKEEIEKDERLAYLLSR